MQPQANISRFDTLYCDGLISTDERNNQDIIVFGKIHEKVQGNTIRYVAASPPDYRATFTGSGLPFANQSQAFHNTPNKGVITLIDDTFEVALMYPNSYYIGLGTVIVPPTLYIYYINNEGIERDVKIQLSEGIPYRLLSYPAQQTKPRIDATFYAGGWNLPVRSQEQVLRDSAYPSLNTMDVNFWGLKPPL